MKASGPSGPLDDTFCDIFLNVGKTLGMIFHVYFLPADKSQETTYLIKQKKMKLSSAAYLFAALYGLIKV